MIPDLRGSRAVFVGIDAYTGMSPLPATAGGTRRLSELLRDLWGLPDSHVTVLGAAASGQEILSAVRDAARATSDTLVVYFAGHGLRDLDGANLYLCLADADPEYPQVGTLAYRDLRLVLRQAGAKARYRLTVLDCCFSGLAGAMSPHGVATRAELAEVLHEAPTPESDPSEDYGDVVLTSAPHDRQSFVRPGAEYPEATGELIKILEHGIPGAGPELSVALAWRRVRMRLLARGSPSPQQFAQNTVADSLGFPNRAAATTAPTEVRAPATRHGAASPGSSAGTGQTQDGGVRTPPAVPASAPGTDWQPAPAGRWRPEEELPYPTTEYDTQFEQQRTRLSLLDGAWANLKKEFKTVRSRLRVPRRVRSPLRVATWLYQSTGDRRWTVIAESVAFLQNRWDGYARRGVSDPYAAQAAHQVPGGISRPDYELSMDTVNAYRERVDQLRADLRRLTDLHADPQE